MRITWWDILAIIITWCLVFAMMMGLGLLGGCINVYDTTNVNVENVTIENEMEIDT
jgi:hypothetical protein